MGNKRENDKFRFLLRTCECNDYFYDIKSTFRSQNTFPNITENKIVTFFTQDLIR